jgi:hypothetical protein
MRWKRTLQLLEERNRLLLCIQQFLGSIFALDTCSLDIFVDFHIHMQILVGQSRVKNKFLFFFRSSI